jgi:hypothetical protein
MTNIRHAIPDSGAVIANVDCLYAGIVSTRHVDTGISWLSDFQ